MTQHITPEQVDRLTTRLAEIAAATDGYILAEMREFGEEPSADTEGRRIPNKNDYYREAEGVVDGIACYLDVPLKTLAATILEIAE